MIIHVYIFKPNNTGEGVDMYIYIWFMGVCSASTCIWVKRTGSMRGAS